MQQDKSWISKFKAALVISQMDKESRKVDKGGPVERDFTQTIVEHKGKKQTEYVPKLPDEINEDNIAKKTEEPSLNPEIAVCQVFDAYKLPKYEGQILKKSPHWVQGWQDRYVTVGENRLLYYQLEDRENPFGVLDFNIMTYSLQEIKDKDGQLLEFVLQPYKQDKMFEFKGSNNQETLKFYSVVKENLQSSEGAKRILDSLNKYFRYWRTDRIGCEQFEKSANTADILLFRGSGTNCVVQRTFTGSEYDHAALLLRFSSGSLYIFEATGYYGVGLCSWESMIKNRWFELYEKLVFRRLDIERNGQFLQQVQSFVNENMGKKYSCSPQKLLKMKSTIVDTKDTKKEERTFFCSELVAALYKELELLPKELSSAQYWPGSFSSENKKFKLLKGKLHREQLIDFTKIIK